MASNRDDPTPKLVSMARKEKQLSAQSQIRHSSHPKGLEVWSLTSGRQLQGNSLFQETRD